jgi:ice-binding like protein
MNNSKTFVAVVGIALIIAIGALGGRVANAATATVDLATAGSYSVLAGTAVTNTGPTTTDGSVGVWSGTSVSGFTGPPNGTAGAGIHAGDAAAQQAQSDLVLAYDNAAGRTPFTNVVGGLGGQTLVAGVYRGGGLNLTGTLTLDGKDDPSSVWIFQAASGLTAATSSSVSLINGASPCNVFWQIGSSADLQGSIFVGTVMALTSITIGDSVTVYGRALARNGNVTLVNDRFLSSTCSAPTPPASALPPCEFMVNLPNAPCAGTRQTPVVASTTAPAPSAATVAPSAAAVATSTPTGATATPTGATATPTVVSTPAPVVAGVNQLPSTSTDEQVSPLLILAIALGGLAVLMLLRRPLRHL